VCSQHVAGFPGLAEHYRQVHPDMISVANEIPQEGTAEYVNVDMPTAVESTAELIAGLIELVKTLREERDKWEERAKVSFENNRRLSSLTVEAQELLAQETARRR